MNKEICKILSHKRSQLVPTIFTTTQMDILELYLQNKPLTLTQKSYLYSTIKKKVDALSSLQQEFYITGQNMIPKRVEEAKQILKELGYPKAFISGSFLFKEQYNDIDIFVIGKNRRSYTENIRHYTFITQKDLSKLLFASLAKYSVSTFDAVKQVTAQSENVEDILFIYQWVINQKLEGDNQKELRDLLLKHRFYIHNEIVDAGTLNSLFETMLVLPLPEQVAQINKMVIELLLHLYSPRYISSVLRLFKKSTIEMAKEYNLDNIPIFLDFAKEVHNECRRAQN